MRAWILEEQAIIEERPLKLVEAPKPHRQDDEVRLRVLVCGVCRTDIHIAEGDLPLKKSPIILGHEIVGVVDEVGENVERFNVGDQAGAYWLHSACGGCKYCLSQREKLPGVPQRYHPPSTSSPQDSLKQKSGKKPNRAIAGPGHYPRAYQE